MASLATENRNAKKLQSAVRGTWVKLNGDYHTNAFEAVEVARTETSITYDTLSDYTVSVTKQNGRWFVYAEEHDIDEMVRNETQPVNGFATLREAKEAAERFGEYFEVCWKEAESIPEEAREIELHDQHEAAEVAPAPTEEQIALNLIPPATARNWQEASDIVRAIAAGLPIYWGTGYAHSEPHVIATKKDAWSGEGMGYNVFIYPNGERYGERPIIRSVAIT